MIYTRRAFMGLSLGSAMAMTAERLLGQGVAAHQAKPLAGKPRPGGRSMRILWTSGQPPGCMRRRSMAA